MRNKIANQAHHAVLAEVAFRISTWVSLFSTFKTTAKEVFYGYL